MSQVSATSLRGRFRALTLAGLSSLVLGVSLIGIPTTSSAATTKPQTLLATALRDAIEGKWVHEVGRATRKKEVANFTNVIGSAGGDQVLSVSTGARVEVVALDQKKRLYVRANNLGVDYYLDITTSDPIKFANKWWLVTPIDGNYAFIAADTTLSLDFTDQLAHYGQVTQGPNSTLDGVRVRSLQWSVAGTKASPKLAVTLYLTTKGKVLPVELRETSSSSSLVIKWSKWGVSVPMKIPKATVFPLLGPSQSA
jgi:hypothetical protein